MNRDDGDDDSVLVALVVQGGSPHRIERVSLPGGFESLIAAFNSGALGNVTGSDRLNLDALGIDAEDYPASISVRVGGPGIRAQLYFNASCKQLFTALDSDERWHEPLKPMCASRPKGYRLAE